MLVALPLASSPCQENHQEEGKEKEGRNRLAGRHDRHKRDKPLEKEGHNNLAASWTRMTSYFHLTLVQGGRCRSTSSIRSAVMVAGDGMSVPAPPFPPSSPSFLLNINCLFLHPSRGLTASLPLRILRPAVYLPSSLRSPHLPLALPPLSLNSPVKYSFTHSLCSAFVYTSAWGLRREGEGGGEEGREEGKEGEREDCGKDWFRREACVEHAAKKEGGGERVG